MFSVKSQWKLPFSPSRKGLQPISKVQSAKLTSLPVMTVGKEGDTEMNEGLGKKWISNNVKACLCCLFPL